LLKGINEGYVTDNMIEHPVDLGNIESLLKEGNDLHKKKPETFLKIIRI